MKITAVALYHVSVPLPRAFWPTWIPGYPQTHNNFTLIELETDEGLVGWSAGMAMGKERQGLGDLLGGYLIGADPTDIDRIQSLLQQAGYLGWRNFWIEPACWDIVGKKQGRPVYEVLGGEPRVIDIYASTGELHTPEQRADELLSLQAKGFKAAKLRVRRNTLAEDIEDIETIKRRIGDSLGLAVDANQGWLVSIVDRIPVWDLKRALEFARVCHSHGILWLEEPLDAHDYEGCVALKKGSKLKIAGGELSSGWDELKIMLEKDCYDLYQPDATFAGGIAQVKRTIDACRKKKRDFTPHTWTNGIGFHINWNLALAHKGKRPLEYPLEEPSWIPEVREGIIDPILPDRGGQLRPFTRPGLGFEIDRKKLKRYGTRFFRMNARSLAVKITREKGLTTALELKKRKQQI